MSADADGAVRSGPLVILRLEGAAMFATHSAAYAWSGQSWWIFAGVFFLPDLTMLAYLANARIGSAAYNASHTTVAPVALGVAGLLMGDQLIPWLAAVWAAHIGFDRMFGYGLKYSSAFGDTHLGRVAAGESRSKPVRRFRLCVP